MSYYSIEDIADIASAQTLEELVRIAFLVISRMPGNICWVAGPLTSGSRTEEENRKRLCDVIVRLKERGGAIINYLPLQKQALNILFREFRKKLPRREKKRKLLKAEKLAIQELLRDKLYAPIFGSGKIHILLILPESASSTNVQFFKGAALASGIPIRQITEEHIPR